METKTQIVNRSAEMDEWLSKIEDHCEYESYRGLIDINKLNLAECIVDAIEDAIQTDRENQLDNAVMALKKIVTLFDNEIETCGRVGEYQSKMNAMGDKIEIEKIIKSTYGELP